NQALYLSELSLHNLGQEGSFAYTTGASTAGAWKKEVTANKGFAIALSDVTKKPITSTEAVDVTATDGAILVIPQARTKVDVSTPKDALFSGNRENSYIKMVYSLKNTVANAWIVGVGSEFKEQVTAYIPVDVNLTMNQVANYVISFGAGNGGYDDGGNPIVDAKKMIHVYFEFYDWDAETLIKPMPTPTPSAEEGKMSFSIETENAGHEYCLPFGAIGRTGNYELTVDWGDGTDSLSIPTGASLAGGITHTYEKAGSYTITITSSEKDVKKAQMPKVSWRYDKLLKSIDTPLLNTAATDFKSVFYSCTFLSSIPAGLFKYNTAATDFGDAFYNCRSLSSLPADLFKYNTAATDFLNVFRECTSLSSLPVALFKYNTAVANFQSAFNSCISLSSIP
ncbi:MAG: hypothetical protein ACRCZZ_07530, partial [Phocaeicola sp.]